MKKFMDQIENLAASSGKVLARTAAVLLFASNAACTNGESAEKSANDIGFDTFINKAQSLENPALETFLLETKQDITHMESTEQRTAMGSEITTRYYDAHGKEIGRATLNQEDPIKDQRTENLIVLELNQNARDLGNKTIQQQGATVGNTNKGTVITMTY